LAAEFWLLNRSKSAGGGSLCTWSKLLKLAIFGKMITNPGKSSEIDFKSAVNARGCRTLPEPAMPFLRGIS
jgi:hypothetical protein